jgi:hypothetical protein
MVLVRRTALPAHADFGGLSSGAFPIVVRLDVMSFPPRSFMPTVAGCLLGGILLDVIGGVEIALREGCNRHSGAQECLVPARCVSSPTLTTSRARPRAASATQLTTRHSRVVTDHVQQDINPTSSSSTTRHSLRGRAGRERHDIESDDDGGAPELHPPKSACAGDTVLRTSTRGTVPIGLCAGCKMSQHIRIGPEPVLTAHAPSKLRKKPMVDSNFSLI